MRPFVSVVIPAHNPGRYIEPCIRSILRQTMRRERFEVIFVDDGSSDGTAERLNRLAGEQPAHPRDPHPGLGRARPAPERRPGGRSRRVRPVPRRRRRARAAGAGAPRSDGAPERLGRRARASSPARRWPAGRTCSRATGHRRPSRRRRPSSTRAWAPRSCSAQPSCASTRSRSPRAGGRWRTSSSRSAPTSRRGVISILGDEPCYFFNKREDEGHISAEPIDPAAHVAAPRPDPGRSSTPGSPDASLRRRFVARFYRTEVLARLTGPRVHRRSGRRPGRAVPARSAASPRTAFARTCTPGWARSRGSGRGSCSTATWRASSRSIAGSTRSRSTRGFGARRGRTGASSSSTAPTLTHGRRRAATHPRRPRRRDVPRPVGRRRPGRPDRRVRRAGLYPRPAVARRPRNVARVDRARHGRPHAPRRRRRPAPASGCRASHGFVELDPHGVGPGGRPLDDGTWDVMIRMLGLGSGRRVRCASRSGSGRRAAVRPAGAPRPAAALGRPKDGSRPRAPDRRRRTRAAAVDHRQAGAPRPARRRRGGDRAAGRRPIARGTLATGRLRLTGRAGSFVAAGDVPRLRSAELVVAAACGHAGPVPRGRYELTVAPRLRWLPGLTVGAAHVRDDGRLVVLGIAPRAAADAARQLGELVTAASSAPPSEPRRRRARGCIVGRAGSRLPHGRRPNGAPCYPRADVPGPAAVSIRHASGRAIRPWHCSARASRTSSPAGAWSDTSSRPT